MRKITLQSLILSALSVGAYSYATDVVIPEDALPTGAGNYTIYSTSEGIVQIDVNKTTYNPTKLTFATGDGYTTPSTWQLNGNRALALGLTIYRRRK